MANKLLHAKPRYAKIRIGNTYSRLSKHDAQWNRSRTKRKIHEWAVFVDVFHGDSSLIKNVEFYSEDSEDPFSVCRDPINVEYDDGSWAVRFETHKVQTAHAFVCYTMIEGNEGGFVEFHHRLCAKDGESTSQTGRIFKSITKAGEITLEKPLIVSALTESRTFGIELELSDANGNNRAIVAKEIQRSAGIAVTNVDAYRDAHNQLSQWKLVHDGSLQCSRAYPSCSKFELVSPILQGERGIVSCYKIIEALKKSSWIKVKVNRSMGVHVHVSVEGMSLKRLKWVCQNFIKYEDAMDSFMPQSRRADSNEYIKSCKAGIRNASGTIAKLNGGRHNAIQNCSTRDDLCRLMNPNGRYYKLNFQNIVTGRQPTIEFRQHSATCNPNKVSAWVRFCVAFVHNSALDKEPDYLKNSCGATEQFNLLFDEVIKDRALKNFFADRRVEVAANDQEWFASSRGPPCCSSCAHGGHCAERSH